MILKSLLPFPSVVWQQKGRRGKVFGKVNCKNIKQDCPQPECDSPILLPGHCCRTCPKGELRGSGPSPFNRQLRKNQQNRLQRSASEPVMGHLVNCAEGLRSIFQSAATVAHFLDTSCRLFRLVRTLPLAFMLQAGRTVAPHKGD